MKFEAPTTLKELVVGGQAVAFVGAGFSIPCGMPTWSTLVEKLVARLEMSQPSRRGNTTDVAKAKYLAKSRRFQEAASLIRRNISKAELNREIERQFALDVYQKARDAEKNIINDRLDLLLKVSFAGILTTNYDQLIEMQIAKSAQVNIRQSHLSEDQLGDVLCGNNTDQRFFVKLHGSVSGSDYVLSSEDYGNKYIRSSIVEYFLISAMMRYHFVFIGCSLEDEILNIRRKLCGIYNRNIPPAYALLPDTDFNRARSDWLYENAQVYALLYRPKRTGLSSLRHSAVEEFLKSLVNREDPANDSRRTVGQVDAFIKNKPKAQRYELIGGKNQAIINLIKESGSLRHENIRSSAKRKMNSTFLKMMSSDELVYRIFFLQSLDLIKETQDGSGSVVYVLS